MAKLAGIISIIAGLIMLVSGATTWGMVSNQLAAENITVPQDAAMMAGEKVKGPLTAYAQADVINHHALESSGGKTYAELGAEARKAEESGDAAKAAELQETRTSVMNGSFLRASLFTSVVAFGVSALVMGSGLLFTLLGLAMLGLARHLTKAHDREHVGHVRHDDRPVAGGGSTATV